MKILIITPYVTLLDRPELSRNKTGFGYMVHSIANEVGSKEKVEVLCSESRGREFDDNGIIYLKRSVFVFFIHILKCISPFVVYRLLKYRMKWGTMIRLIYSWMMTGYISEILQKRGYDIVHIHGCCFATELWISVCRRNNLKFVVTLHGLNSRSNTVYLESAGKKYEQDFLFRVAQGEFPITVISTGMKRQIESYFGKKSISCLSVVCNSFFIKDNSDLYESNDIRKKYKLPNEAKIILYVGNVSENKNQMQIVRAYSKLSKDLQKRVYVMFCGAPDSKQSLEKLIACQKNKEHLIMCGMVDNVFMPLYYSQADGVALLSRSEGFGLSLIEGMHFGLPCMMFRDMDAFDDIYDERAVVAINNRSDKDVSEGLETLIKKSWDKDIIKDYSMKFEGQSMAANYIRVYNRILFG